MFGTDEAKRDALIADWEAKKQALASAQQAEMSARLAVVGLFHEDYTNLAGTENVELPRGWTLKMEFSQNYNVPTAKNGEAAHKCMAKLSKLPGGEEIAKRIFRWAPKLDKREYDNLAPAAKRIVNEVVKTSPATPAISLVPPKVG